MEKLTLKGLFIIIVVLTISTAGGAWYILNQQDEIDELNFRISSLLYQTNVLSSRCNLLETNMSAVLGELEGEIGEMQWEYDQLEADYESLEYDYAYLVYEFEGLKDDHRQLQNDFGNYTAHFKQLQKKVNSRINIEGDLTEFVTPQDLLVVETMMGVTGGHEDPESLSELWADYEALYDWITATITYGVDSPYPYLYSDPSYPVRWIEHSARYPNETLTDGMGDCEDQAILLLSMMMAHNDRFAKMCISLKWEDGGHIAVAFPVTGGKLAILDPTGGYISGTGGIFSGEPVEEAIENWVSRWGYSDVYVNSVFNDLAFEDFESTQEFIDWFNSKYD